MRKIISYFSNNYRFISWKIFTNISWLVGEQFVRMILALFVSVLLARYLGPKDFGILAYSISLVTLFGTFTYLGLSGIVVRDLSKKPYIKEEILGSTYVLKLLGGIIGYTLILLIILISNPPLIEKTVIIIVGFILVFKPIDTIDYWFQSRTESKYSVIVKSAAFFLCAIIKIILVILKASLLQFSIIVLFEFILAFIFLIGIYHFKDNWIISWKPKRRIMKNLLSQSWMILLSGLLSMIYLKVDQIMLRWIIGAKEVGIYSIAVTYSEIWYFIPTAIALSFLPSLIKIRNNKREYHERLQKIFNLLFLLSITIAIVITFIGPFFIEFLYGYEYRRSGWILTIHIWAGTFIFMRALLSKWIIIENKFKISVITHGFGAIINILLNIILIPPLLGFGAAIATLVSYSVASYVMLFFISETRHIAKMMTRSIIFPYRIIQYFSKQK